MVCHLASVEKNKLYSGYWEIQRKNNSRDRPKSWGKTFLALSSRISDNSFSDFMDDLCKVTNAYIQQVKSGFQTEICGIVLCF